MPPKKNANARGDKNLTQKSPAEFFQDNKGIAGFENAGKSLYTTLREFIENALDAAEAIGTLPEIDIAVEEVSVSQYENLIGLKAHVRLDDELYADFESDKAKAKRTRKQLETQARTFQLRVVDLLEAFVKRSAASSSTSVVRLTTGSSEHYQSMHYKVPKHT